MRTVCIIGFEELYLLIQNFLQRVLCFIDRQKKSICTEEHKLSGTAVNRYVLTFNLSSLALFLFQLRCIAGCSTAS